MTHFIEKYINPFTDYGFKKLFETAEIAKFTPEQVLSYEDSLKYYRDLKNSLDTAKEEGREDGFEEGMEKGIEQGKIVVAKNLLQNGVDENIIIASTGLTLEEINNLRNDI